jgi:hypothetical protein
MNTTNMSEARQGGRPMPGDHPGPDEVRNVRNTAASIRRKLRDGTLMLSKISNRIAPDPANKDNVVETKVQTENIAYILDEAEDLVGDVLRLAEVISDKLG